MRTKSPENTTSLPPPWTASGYGATRTPSPNSTGGAGVLKIPTSALSRSGPAPPARNIRCAYCGGTSRFCCTTLGYRAALWRPAWQTCRAAGLHAGGFPDVHAGRGGGRPRDGPDGQAAGLAFSSPPPHPRTFVHHTQQQPPELHWHRRLRLPLPPASAARHVYYAAPAIRAANACVCGPQYAPGSHVTQTGARYSCLKISAVAFCMGTVINKQLIMSAMKSKGLLVRNFREKYFIISMTTIFSCILLAMFGLINFTNTFENYQYYQQFLNTAFGAVLGLATVITMFYLGKLHDYKKGFLQTESRINILYESYSKKAERLISLRKILKQYITQIPQFLERIPEEKIMLLEINSEKLDHVKKLEDMFQNVTYGIRDVFVYSRPMRACMIVLFALAVVWIMGNLWPIQTDGLLYYQAGMLAAVVISTLMFWKQYERHMGTLHDFHHALLQNLSQCQSHLSDVEGSISDFRDVINIVETKYVNI